RLLGTFPYGRPQDGTSSSIQNIDFADLIDAKGRFMTADNATIAVYGNFDRKLGYRAIRRYFGGWIKSDKKIPATFRQPDAPLPAVLNVVWPKPGAAAIRFAMRGVARNDKNFAPSMVYTTILENRLQSRVPAIFADDLFVRNEAYALPGLIVIGFAAGKRDVGSSNGAIEANDLVGSALSDPITDAEFRASKIIVQALWAKKDAQTFWLDADTYKTTSPDTDARIADNVKFADVIAYAEKARKLPIATVLLNAPPPVK
ncbi:MAG: insulinase family protein, partial [Pyrinomonadaceae bacterium]